MGKLVSRGTELTRWSVVSRPLRTEVWRLLPHASSAPAWPASARLSPAPAIEDVLLRPVRPQTLPALFGLLPRMQKKKMLPDSQLLEGGEGTEYSLLSQPKWWTF